MAMWEYKVVSLGFSDSEGVLNSFGEERWELVEITSEGGVPRAYLKRELVYGASDRLRPDAAGAVTPSTPPQPVGLDTITVRVSARDDPRVTGWLDTGIDIGDGCPGLSFSINGDILESSGAVVGPDGRQNRLVLNEAIGMELPSGCLVARIGEEGTVEPVFDVGFLAVDETGRLYLAVNDESYDDNEGEFVVGVSVL